MPETSLSIESRGIGTLKIEPIDVRGNGGPEYPIVILPITLRLNPLDHRTGEQHFVILNIQCSLFLQGYPHKIADATSNFDPKVVKYSDTQTGHDIEFPLDIYRIEKIEEKRKDDLRIILKFRFRIGMLIPLIVNSEGGGKFTEEFLSEFKTSSVEFNLEIPQSHWVGKVLPRLGYGKSKIIEIPITETMFGKEFPKSLKEFELAQEYFNKGDYDKTVAHCRSAIEPIKTKISEFKQNIDSNTEHEWVKAISSGTYDWLDKITKKTIGLTSKTHHLPSIGHFSRHDAEAIMLVTTALISYVSRLSVSD